MLLHFNPLHIESNDHTNFLYGFFKHHENTPAFLKGRYYTYHYAMVRFSHTVLQTQEPQRYHVLANTELGTGAYSVIYPIKTDIRFSNADVCIYEKPAVPVIAKVQSIFGNTNDINYFKKKLLHEYELSKSGHLNAMMPLFLENQFSKSPYEPECSDITGIMVLNQMDGIEFFSLLEIIRLQNDVSCFLRFRLTLELLNAFNEQVFQKNIVHGDLKPENLIITGGDGTTPDTFVAINALSNKNFVPSWKFKVIDFEGAEFLGKERNILIATKRYAAPETLKMVKKEPYPAVDDEKTDLFSVGKIIASVWGLDPDETPSLIDEQACNMRSLERSPYYYEQESNLFTTSLLPSIYAAIACMTLTNPQARWGLKQSLTFFEKTLDQYNHLEFMGTLPESAEPIEPELDRIIEENRRLAHTTIGFKSMNHSSPVSISEINDDDIICVKRSAKSPVNFFNRPVIIEKELSAQKNSIKSDDDSSLNEMMNHCGLACHIM